MNDKEMTLVYENENDRAFGLAGMAISLASLDAIDRIAEVSLDADGPMVAFSHTYYFSGSPSVSPKATWNNLLQNFHITASMVVGNVMARSLVRLQSEVPEEVMTQIHDMIVVEGRETCSLEDDEIENLYRRTLSYSRRIFGNPRLHPAVEQFASLLALRRQLSGQEILEELHRLQFV